MRAIRLSRSSQRLPELTPKDHRRRPVQLSVIGAMVLRAARRLARNSRLFACSVSGAGLAGEKTLVGVDPLKSYRFTHRISAK